MELQTIKQKHYFEKIIKEGRKTVNSYFVVYHLPSLFFHDNTTRFGISVGKKIGNAVKRNYYKRCIRNFIRDNEINIEKKYIIVILRPKALKLDYHNLEREFISVLQGVK